MANFKLFSLFILLNVANIILVVVSAAILTESNEILIEKKVEDQVILVSTTTEDLKGEDPLLEQKSDSEEVDGKANCDILLSLFEIYNATNIILGEIQHSAANVTVWSGGMTFIPKDTHFEEVDWTKESMNAVYNQELYEPGQDIKPPEVLLFGVPLNVTETFLAAVNKLGVGYKDMDYRLCVHFFETENIPDEDYFDKVLMDAGFHRNPNPFNSFTIPSHITPTLYPDIFCNILIDSSKSSGGSSSLSSSSSSSSPFTYYITHDSKSDLIKLEHGTLPDNVTSEGWVWMSSDDNSEKYNLISAKEPNKKVVIGPNGNLALSSSSLDATNPNEDSAPALLFSLSYDSNLDDFSILSEVYGHTYCVVQYFASTLRLLQISEPEVQQQCTRFKLRVGGITVTSTKHNTTFIDLYSTKNSERLDTEEGNINLMQGLEESTTILYFTSDPIDFDIFIRGTAVSTQLQDLRSLAKSYLENGTICLDNFLQNANEMKPILTCKLVHQHQQETKKENVPIQKENSMAINIRPGQIYRQYVRHENQVQLFRNFMKFRFLSDGLKNCDNESGLLCVGEVSMSESSVKDVINVMGVGYSEIVKAGEYMYYWMEGMINYLNSTVEIEQVLDKKFEAV